MFTMSKKELFARLSASLTLSNENGGGNNHFLFFAPCGMVACEVTTAASLEDMKKDGTLNYFEMGLSTPIPNEAANASEKESSEIFLLCKEVQITTYSGAKFNLPYLCLALKDIFGFSFGALS
ncbi:MAG: hypothetical protein KHX40_00635 [Oscillospiraceae bacterium]|nr:hypothetical protein [Oscillospiraceae bacterium]